MRRLVIEIAIFFGLWLSFSVLFYAASVLRGVFLPVEVNPVEIALTALGLTALIELTRTARRAR